MLQRFFSGYLKLLRYHKYSLKLRGEASDLLFRLPSFYISLKLQLEQSSYRDGNEHSYNTTNFTAGKKRNYDQYRMDFHVAAQHPRIDYITIDKHNSCEYYTADDQMAQGAFCQTYDYQ